jgi:hypothetical protein
LYLRGRRVSWECEQTRQEQLTMKHPPRNIVIDWLNTIWETNLPPSAKLVACCLRRYMNSQNDMAWPAVGRITGECGFKSDRTTQAHLKTLCEEGWLSIVGTGPHGTIKYQAATPAKIAPPQITTDTPANIAPELNKELNNNTYKGFTPPTIQEVEEYTSTRPTKIDSERFIDFYLSKGWMIGKNKMKDWKAAVRNWEKNNGNSKQPKRQSIREVKVGGIREISVN